MTFRIIFLSCMLFYPIEAWAKYGRSSSGWYFFIALLAICVLLAIYGAAAANEEKKAKERYESILNAKKCELERDAFRQRNEIENEGKLLKNNIIQEFSKRELEIQQKRTNYRKKRKRARKQITSTRKTF